MTLYLFLDLELPGDLQSALTLAHGSGFTFWLFAGFTSLITTAPHPDRFSLKLI